MDSGVRATPVGQYLCPLQCSTCPPTRAVAEHTRDRQPDQPSRSAKDPPPEPMVAACERALSCPPPIGGTLKARRSRRTFPTSTFPPLPPRQAAPRTPTTSASGASRVTAAQSRLPATAKPR